jgi:hypothetical protein
MPGHDYANIVMIVSACDYHFWIAMNKSRGASIILSDIWVSIPVDFGLPRYPTMVKWKISCVFKKHILYYVHSQKLAAVLAVSLNIASRWDGSKAERQGIYGTLKGRQPFFSPDDDQSLRRLKSDQVAEAWAQIADRIPGSLPARCAKGGATTSSRPSRCQDGQRKKTANCCDSMPNSARDGLSSADEGEVGLPQISKQIPVP